jgi:hypothetical protein
MSVQVCDKKTNNPAGIIKILCKVGYIERASHIFCTLIHPSYDSRSFSIDQNSKVSVADSKI